MTVRQLARDARDYPATFVFCASWIVVFAAMTCAARADGNPYLTLWRWLVVGVPGAGARFGDLALYQLDQDQYWRLITCTFVHFSVLHVVLNLVAMYQLGTLFESWYGTPRLVWIYGLTGAGGNLISALARDALGSSRMVHSAGGSVVILGLVGLGAAAGWRSKWRKGRRLARQMVLVLVLTAVLGAALPRFLDNWGHFGGAVMGCAIGLAHRRLVVLPLRPAAWGWGALAALAIIGAGAAQYFSDHRTAMERTERRLEARADLRAAAEADLNLIGKMVLGRGGLQDALRILASAERFADARSRTALQGQLQVMRSRKVYIKGPTVAAVGALLEAYQRLLDGPERADLLALRPLIETALKRDLDETERAAFKQLLAQAVRRLQIERRNDRETLSRLRDRTRARISPSVPPARTRNAPRPDAAAGRGARAAPGRNPRSL